jgi:hypothetical protein
MQQGRSISGAGAPVGRAGMIPPQEILQAIHTPAARGFSPQQIGWRREREQAFFSA